MKWLTERRAIAAAVIMVLLLALGYGLNRAPAEWASLLRLCLPIAVAALALSAGRAPALVGALLSFLFLLPGLAEATRAGAPLRIAMELIVFALCLGAAGLLSPYVDQRRDREGSPGRRFPALCLDELSSPVGVARAILDEALRVTGAEVGEVLLQRGDSLERVAARGRTEGSLAALAVSQGDERTIGQWVLEEGCPCSVCLSESPGQGRNLGSVIAVPMEGQKGLKGLLCVANRDGHTFEPGMSTQLQVAAERGALALERVCVDDVREGPDHYAEEFTVLEEIGRAVGAREDLRSTLEAILQSTRRLIDFDMGEITLWDAEQGCLVSQGALDTEAYHEEVGEVYHLDEGYTGWLARHREPLLITDIPRREDVRPKLDRPDYPFRSYLGIPLGSGDRFMGTLELISYRPDAFSPADVEVLQAVGMQASVAIENAYLYTRVEQELQRRAVALSGMQRIGREVSTTSDQQEVLQLVLEEAARLSGATCCAILLHDPASGDWQIAVSEGYPEQGREPLRRHLSNPPEESAFFEVESSGQSLYIADVAEREWVSGLGEAIRSTLLIPIWYGDATAGIILLGSEELDAFDQETKVFVEGLAAQAAIAIGNARRHREQLEWSALLKKRADQLNRILMVSQAVRSDRPLAGVLQEIAHAVRESVGFDWVLISVLEGDPTHLRRIAAAGLPDDVVERLKSTPQSWRAMEVVMREEFRISQSYYVPAEEQERWRGVLDVHEAGREKERRESNEWHPQDLLIVPLLSPGRNIRGILSVDRPRNGKVPDRSTIEALEIFAAQAGVAIENSRLVEDLQGRLELITFFNELNRHVTAKRELSEVLQTVADATTRLVDCDGSVLFLLDEDTGRYVPRASHGYVLDEIAHSAFTPGEGLAGRVVESEMPLTATDVEMDLEELAFVESGAVALIPLSIGERVVGVLAADRKKRESFSSTDVATLTALADQVAVAVQNARLFDEAVRRTDELSTLLEASSAISSTLDLSWTLQALGDRLLAVTEAEDFVISEWDREQDQMAVVWEAGREKADRARVGVAYDTNERPVVAEVLLTQDPLVVSEPEEADDWPYPLEGQVLLLPMVASGQTVGLVELSRQDKQGDFTAREIRLGQALANQAAVAMQNAQLYEEVRRFSEDLERRVEERTEELEQALEDLTVERDRVEVLYRIASELSSSLDLGHVLSRTLKFLAEAIGAEQGAVLLQDLDQGQLVYRSAYGSSVSIPPGGRPANFQRGEGLAWWIVEEGESVLVEDLEEEPRWISDQGGDGVRRACVAAPLGKAGEVQGALLLYHPETDFFTEDHLRMVEVAASQMANTIGNAALYSLIREQAEELGGMLKRQQVEAAKSQAILEGVADGVVVTDDRGRVILFNAAAERVLEIPRDQVLGRSTDELVASYGVKGKAWLEAIEKWTGESEEGSVDDFAAERLQVSDRVISVHIAPVHMGGEYLGTVSVFRDVTAEVEAARAKSEFVSTVSHELRTPMTSIKGYADLLLMGAAGELSDEQNRFVDIICTNADRLSGLVNDLLDISRIEAGRIELELDELQVGDVVEQVVDMLKGHARDQGLTLKAELPPHLPCVWGDEDRVAQILTNLIGNAIQYTPDGGRITVSASEKDDMLEVCVSDTGIGISKKDQAKIFERFFRADSPEVRDQTGTGLGLSITSSLVQMHGGSMWVESELGEGSTFAFTLPLAEAAELPEVALSQILVVEDDRDVANLIRIHLESQGHHVVIAERGDEAIELAEELHPDLMTLDVRLPDADGFDILKQLKESPATADMPVVIVSVMPCEEEGLRLGATGYVAKPIEEEALLGTVRVGLDRGGGDILVVEDDADTLALVAKALERQGFGVQTARRGREAIRMARENRPSLVLLDIKLEDIDGYQVMRELKSDPLTWDVPIVVMTGSLSQTELKREGVLALGAERFLTKPFAVEELIQEITAVLKQPQT